MLSRDFDKPWPFFWYSFLSCHLLTTLQPDLFSLDLLRSTSHTVPAATLHTRRSASHRGHSNDAFILFLSARDGKNVEMRNCFSSARRSVNDACQLLSSSRDAHLLCVCHRLNCLVRRTAPLFCAVSAPSCSQSSVEVGSLSVSLGSLYPSFYIVSPQVHSQFQLCILSVFP